MKIEGSFDESFSPHIEIPISGKKISVVVDTGFNGELMLPRLMLEGLGFKYSMKSEAELADGSIVETTIYSGKISWFGRERIVQAVATESEDGLMGTEMLFGLTLFMDLDENRVVLENKGHT
ncbi:MAG: clan AA aspartic protease [Candidatus Aenigmarchaeota archaeon]|nr:clan AA aspartic protease [Candidatus Aenigmarchaeota archaeon]